MQPNYFLAAFFLRMHPHPDTHVTCISTLTIYSGFSGELVYCGDINTNSWRT